MSTTNSPPTPPPANTAAAPTPPTGAPEQPDRPGRTTHTAEALAAALAAHPTRSAAAASLGMDPSSFRRIAKRLGVAWPTGPRAPGSAGGKWSAANRKHAAREWARRKRGSTKVGP